MAHKFGQKTLVIVHTSMLRDQWVKEVKQLFNIEAGVIGGGIKDIKDKVIVIANIQTLSKIADSLSGEFGTVIIDEAHHVPADTFTNTLDLLKARYRIALSGTMQRKDGKHVLFKDFFGPTVHKPPQNNTINPEVLIIKTGIKLVQGIQYAKKINFLLEDPDYIEFIAATAKVQAAKGHKVLIIAERVGFLRKVQELLGPKCILIVGATAYEAERIRMGVGLESGALDYVAGSRQIFSEGISENILSCMILASPLSSIPLLEQLAGRIMRLHPNKPNPILIDMNFVGANEKKQNNIRLGFYIQKGWDIKAV